MLSWITNAAWLDSSGRGGTGTGEEHQLPDCKKVLGPQKDVNPPPPLVPQAWQSPWPDRTSVSSRGPPKSREPGCPGPSYHQAPGTLADSLSLSEMSYLV